jgi:hypothetical protein
MRVVYQLMAFLEGVQNNLKVLYQSLMGRCCQPDRDEVCYVVLQASHAAFHLKRVYYPQECLARVAIIVIISSK